MKDKPSLLPETDQVEWDESDCRDVAAWLIREADQRIKFFPQRRDGVDALIRHLAAGLRVRRLVRRGVCSCGEVNKENRLGHRSGCRYFTDSVYDLSSRPEQTTNEDSPTVCIAHGSFIPCRKSGEHRYTSNPFWVKSVRDYQTSAIEALTWEPAWE